jgi:hypothetical protein
MRQQVIDLQQMGPLPPSDVAIRNNMQALVDKYAALIAAIEPPISDDEAKILVKLFGSDDCFGVAWSILHLIETAPHWPLMDCLGSESNEWIIRLKQRAARGKLERRNVK